MRNLGIILVLMIINSSLFSQFYSGVWVQSIGFRTGSATVMSCYEFPFDKFEIKFNEKGMITDSSDYPSRDKYFVAEVISISKDPVITAYLIGEMNLCVECGYWIYYQKMISESECYFLDDGWSFEGEHQMAMVAFKKQLKKKTFKKKDFFHTFDKWVRGSIWNGQISF